MIYKEQGIRKCPMYLIYNFEDYLQLCYLCIIVTCSEPNYTLSYVGMP
jgi:hypothetical protein